MRGFGFAVIVTGVSSRDAGCVVTRGVWHRGFKVILKGFGFIAVGVGISNVSASFTIVSMGCGVGGCRVTIVRVGVSCLGVWCVVVEVGRLSRVTKRENMLRGCWCDEQARAGEIIGSVCAVEVGREMDDVISPKTDEVVGGGIKVEGLLSMWFYVIGENVVVIAENIPIRLRGICLGRW